MIAAARYPSQTVRVATPDQPRDRGDGTGDAQPDRFLRAGRQLATGRGHRPSQGVEHERGVVTAQPVVAGHRRVQAHVAGAADDVVDAGAVGIEVGQVDGRGDPAVGDRQRGQDGFDRAGRPEAVSVHGLRRRDGGAGRVGVAEDATNRRDLRRVAGAARPAVCVDVADGLDVDARIEDGGAHRARLAGAGRVGIGDVVRVGARAVPGDLADDVRAAGGGVFELLQDRRPPRPRRSGTRRGSCRTGRAADRGPRRGVRGPASRRSRRSTAG